MLAYINKLVYVCKSCDCGFTNGKELINFKKRHV